MTLHTPQSVLTENVQRLGKPAEQALFFCVFQANGGKHEASARLKNAATVYPVVAPAALACKKEKTHKNNGCCAGYDWVGCGRGRVQLQSPRHTWLVSCWFCPCSDRFLC